MKIQFVALSEAYPELWEGLELPGELVDCRDIEGTACYLDGAAAEEISLRLAASPSPFLRFIDSGDYHHLSYLRAREAGRPYSLLLLDNHPDMQEAAFGKVLSCGGWLRSLLEDDPFLMEVLIVGIDPALSGETAGFGDRVKAFTREQTGAFEPPRLDYPVFISLDKDVLAPDYARTDWDQGTMTLECLDALLRGTLLGNDVVGIDLCGELPSSKGGTAADRSVNLSTNLHLITLLNNIYLCKK